MTSHIALHAITKKMESRFGSAWLRNGLKFWIGPRHRLAVPAVVMCVAVTCGMPALLSDAVEQRETKSVVTASATAAVIKANPEHVTFCGGSGSTEIEWDTGNGSTGFVYV